MSTEQLNSHDSEERLGGLFTLAEEHFPPPKQIVNTHFHSFFSFNAEDYSPARIAYEAKKQGLAVAGIVDFDTLDGLDEFFGSGDVLHLPVTVSLESRVYVKDFADTEINSPGEPGVLYFMGVGFTEVPAAGSPAAATLQEMRQGAENRNRQLLARLQSVIKPLEINYERDVIPLTPAGNATERHLLAAFDEKAQAMFDCAAALGAYWAKTLGVSEAEITPLLNDTAKRRNFIRAKLMKRGSPGYAQPGPDTFPPLEKVFPAIVAGGALPCWAWLDGTSAGEADAEELCDYITMVGCPAVGIIPERNWNISDPASRVKKVAKFNEFIAAAQKRHLLILCGTEMNNYGQPFVDNFTTPAMQRHAARLLEDAYALYGHSMAQKREKHGLLSDWSRQKFGDDDQARRAYYLDYGRKIIDAKAKPDGGKIY